MLAGLVFSWGLAGNAESDAVVLGEAVGQIQHALPRSAGRAWRRECLASRNRRNRGPAIALRASGRVVVQRQVPGPCMTGLHVGEQAIAWRLGEVVRKKDWQSLAHRQDCQRRSTRPCQATPQTYDSVSGKFSSMVIVWNPNVIGRSARTCNGMLNSNSASVSDLHRFNLRCGCGD